MKLRARTRREIRDDAQMANRISNYGVDKVAVEERRKNLERNTFYRRRNRNKVSVNKGDRANNHRVVDAKYTNGYKYVIFLKDRHHVAYSEYGEYRTVEKTCQDHLTGRFKLTYEGQKDYRLISRIYIMEDSDFFMMMLLINREAIVKVFKIA